MDTVNLTTILLKVSADDAKALFAGMDSDIISAAWGELVYDYAADIGIELNGESLWGYCIDLAIYKAGLDRDKADVRFNYVCSSVYYSGKYTEEQKEKFEKLTGFELQISDDE